MNFNQVFQYGISFSQIESNKEEVVINFTPVHDKEYNSKIFYSPEDQAIIDEIEKVIKS